MRVRALLIVVALAAVGCADSSAAGSGPEAPVESTTTTAITKTTTTSAPTTEAATPTTTTTAPTFRSARTPVDAEELGPSWREGCPVGPDELVSLSLTHWMIDGDVAEGRLIVHRDHADDLTAVFAAIFAAGFPITSMRPVSEFDADDDLSMAADNTSAFNCREVGGRPGVWSQHAYGGAVDINPVRNPYVRGNVVDPPAGDAFVDRAVDDPGMIRAGDAVTEAFASIGWKWGGEWTSARDYQHFSANGR